LFLLDTCLLMNNLQATTFGTSTCLFKMFQPSILTIYHSMLSLDHLIMNNNYVTPCIINMPSTSFSSFITIVHLKISLLINNNHKKCAITITLHQSSSQKLCPKSRKNYLFLT
jgi:hypothetical protein